MPTAWDFIEEPLLNRAEMSVCVFSRNEILIVGGIYFDEEEKKETKCKDVLVYHIHELATRTVIQESSLACSFMGTVALVGDDRAINTYLHPKNKKSYIVCIERHGENFFIEPVVME